MSGSAQIGSMYQVDWKGFGPITRRVTGFDDDFVYMQVMNGDCARRIAALTWDEFWFYRRIAVPVESGRMSRVPRRF